MKEKTTTDMPSLTLGATPGEHNSLPMKGH
jgi:hypothetical protein